MMMAMGANNPLVALQAPQAAPQGLGLMAQDDDDELDDASRDMQFDEDGSEAQWHEVVGAAALAAGADGLWPLITGHP